MNERLEQLAVEAGMILGDASEFDMAKFMPKEVKFAELIINDCLAQVDKVDEMLDDPAEKVGAAWVGLAIAKHFGIEQ
jgi:hypothetical protein